MEFKKPNPQIVINKLKNLSTNSKIITLVLAFLIQLVITFIVYYTGGIQYVYSHSMYIPIMLVSLIFGYKTGVIFGIIGGFLLGPFMPINTETGLMQDTVNWIYRMFFFVFVGFVAGQFSEHTNQYYLEKIKNLRYFLNTDILKPDALVDYIKDKSEEEVSQKLIVKIRFNNKDDLLHVFGDELFLKEFANIANLISKHIPFLEGVFARDLDGVILCYDQEHHEVNMKQILDLTNKTYVINGVNVYFKMTIGIAPLSFDVMRSVHQAAIASLDAFENHMELKFYDNQITKTNRNLELLGAIEQSISEEHFYLVFQPKIDLKTKQCVGAECLIRWNHPKFGHIPPMDFIPLVEKTQLINVLTEWIIKKVFRLLETNIDAYDPLKYPISINVSSANLSKNASVYQTIIHLINTSKLNSHVIQFEITESLLMMNPKESIEVINDLQNHHISFSIDDFGTGYSSFEYLSRFGVKELKIDRSFINRMLQSKHDLNIVKSTIQLAKSLEIITVAEGVETKEQEVMLEKLACDYAQGYYYAKPMTFDTLIDYLKNPS